MTKQKIWQILGRLGYFPSYPLISLYLFNSKRVRVVIKSDNKVLVVKPWLNNGKWDLPGGGLHKNEDPVDGCIRELKEELNLSFDRNLARVIKYEKFRAGLLSYSACYVEVLLKSWEQSLSLQEYEIIDYRWVSEAELRDLPMISRQLNQAAIKALQQV